MRLHNMAADVFPDREGLVICAGDGELVVEAMRRGFPPPPNAGAYYVTNVRNVASGFWKRWLKVEQRCTVPVARLAGRSRAKEQALGGAAPHRRLPDVRAE